MLSFLGYRLSVLLGSLQLLFEHAKRALEYLLNEKNYCAYGLYSGLFTSVAPQLYTLLYTDLQAHDVLVHFASIPPRQWLRLQLSKLGLIPLSLYHYSETVSIARFGTTRTRASH
jgi:hypothetical protein